MTGRRLEGSVALVTGASSGIGAATGRWLAAEGATVVLVARRHGRLEQLRSDIVAAGGAARVVAADLSQPDRGAEVVRQALDELGRLDMLINNAGITRVGTALEARLEDWDELVATNVTALLHVTHAAVPFLIDAVATSGRGVADIVNVTTAGARNPRPGSSVYTMTKLGALGFTESLRQELAPWRVRVSVVEPGAADGVQPIRPEDVADVIGFIVTRERDVAVDEVLVRPC